MHKFLHIFLLLAIATILSLVIYVAIQQNIRMLANDPQIQVAEDYANALSGGLSPQGINRARKIDIAKSLDTFIIIFNKRGNVIATNAELNGQSPVIPNGIFDYIDKNGEDRFTWQPEKDARSAVVVTYYRGKTSGYVLVGRSLREVEMRESALLHEVAIGWVLCIAMGIVSFFILKGKNTFNF